VLRAAVYVTAATLLFALLWLVISPALGMVLAIAALAYGLSWLLKVTQGERDAEFPQSRRWWNPW
jgi:phosphate/sulfate permease